MIPKNGMRRVYVITGIIASVVAAVAFGLSLGDSVLFSQSEGDRLKAVVDSHEVRINKTEDLVQKTYDNQIYMMIELGINPAKVPSSKYTPPQKGK